MARLNFSSFQWIAVPRTCNKVAQALAAAGCVCEEGGNPVLDPLPDCIMELVAADCAAAE